MVALFDSQAGRVELVYRFVPVREDWYRASSPPEEESSNGDGRDGKNTDTKVPDTHLLARVMAAPNPLRSAPIY